MSILILNLFLVVLFIFLLIALSMTWPPDSPWSPWWRTSKKIARIACHLAQIKPQDIVYELGCGDASFVLVAAKEFGAKTIGIEIDPLRFFIAKIRALNSKQTKIIKSDFFDVNLSNANIIFVYLVPKALNKLLPKFKKELKKETKIISFRYQMNLPLNSSDQKNKLYLYKI